MATFNGGRIVALFLSVLFALNVSFAQEPEEVWNTVVFYMVDPINERIASEVEEYIENWNDPLTWETFDRDFTPAREGQMAQVARENAMRVQAGEALLKSDMRSRGDGTSSWYPSWIPLAFAETTEDSLFKNILSLEGARYGDLRQGRRQLLREFFELDGAEPDGEDFITCNDLRPRCRKEFYAFFRELVEIHDSYEESELRDHRGEVDDSAGISATAPIISFTVRARASDEVVTVRDSSFVAELNDQGTGRTGELGPPEIVEFDYESIRLLQPAAMDPDIYRIDIAPYWQPAAKPVSSTEASSWGRIKATFAD